MKHVGINPETLQAFFRKRKNLKNCKFQFLRKITAKSRRQFSVNLNVVLCFCVCFFLFCVQAVWGHLVPTYSTLVQALTVCLLLFSDGREPRPGLGSPDGRSESQSRLREERRGEVGWDDRWDVHYSFCVEDISVI